MPIATAGRGIGIILTGTALVRQVVRRISAISGIGIGFQDIIQGNITDIQLQRISVLVGDLDLNGFGGGLGLQEAASQILVLAIDLQLDIDDLDIQIIRTLGQIHDQGIILAIALSVEVTVLVVDVVELQPGDGPVAALVIGAGLLRKLEGECGDTGLIVDHTLTLDLHDFTRQGIAITDLCIHRCTLRILQTDTDTVTVGTGGQQVIHAGHGSIIQISRGIGGHTGEGGRDIDGGSQGVARHEDAVEGVDTGSGDQDITHIAVLCSVPGHVGVAALNVAAGSTVIQLHALQVLDFVAVVVIDLHIHGNGERLALIGGIAVITAVDDLDGHAHADIQLLLVFRIQLRVFAVQNDILQGVQAAGAEGGSALPFIRTGGHIGGDLSAIFPDKQELDVARQLRGGSELQCQFRGNVPFVGHNGRDLVSDLIAAIEQVDTGNAKAFDGNSGIVIGRQIIVHAVQLDGAQHVLAGGGKGVLAFVDALFAGLYQGEGTFPGTLRGADLTHEEGLHFRRSLAVDFDPDVDRHGIGLGSVIEGEFHVRRAGDGTGFVQLGTVVAVRIGRIGSLLHHSGDAAGSQLQFLVGDCLHHSSAAKLDVQLALDVASRKDVGVGDFTTIQINNSRQSGGFAPVKRHDCQAAFCLGQVTAAIIEQHQGHGNFTVFLVAVVHIQFADGDQLAVSTAVFIAVNERHAQVAQKTKTVCLLGGVLRVEHVATAITLSGTAGIHQRIILPDPVLTLIADDIGHFLVPLDGVGNGLALRQIAIFIAIVEQGMVVRLIPGNISIRILHLVDGHGLGNSLLISFLVCDFGGDGCCV